MSTGTKYAWLRNLRTPNAEIVHLSAIIRPDMCDLMLTAGHPNDASATNAAGLALYCFDATAVTFVDRQVIPGGPERDQYRVASFREF